MALKLIFCLLVGVTLLSSRVESVVDTVVDYTGEVLVESTDPNDIRFLLFNDKTNVSNYKELKYGDLSTVTSSLYDSGKTTKFLVHGFTNNAFTTFPQNLKNAYLKTNQSYNVIVVDWGKLAMPEIQVIFPVFYPLVVNNTWAVGTRVGEFIGWLKDASLIELPRVHIVGHSLGAHISGKAASDVKARFNQSIARVTGLDPAGPEFYIGIFARKLTANDASFVDAYHSDAGQLGIWDSVGKVDFFLNGGHASQPGCTGLDTLVAVFGSVVDTVTGICSHGWATDFYSNTVGNGTLRTQDTNICACNNLLSYAGMLCCSRINVGEYASTSSTGRQFLSYDYQAPT